MKRSAMHLFGERSATGSSGLSLSATQHISDALRDNLSRSLKHLGKIGRKVILPLLSPLDTALIASAGRAADHCSTARGRCVRAWSCPAHKAGPWACSLENRAQGSAPAYAGMMPRPSGRDVGDLRGLNARGPARRRRYLRQRSETISLFEAADQTSAGTRDFAFLL